MQTLLATQVVSISELKKNPTNLVYQAEDNKLVVTVIVVGTRNKNIVYDQAEDSID